MSGLTTILGASETFPVKLGELVGSCLSDGQDDLQNLYKCHSFGDVVVFVGVSMFSVSVPPLKLAKLSREL